MTVVSRALAALLAAPALSDRRVLGVWLFGSRARDAASSSSDVDLGVLCEPPLGSARTAAMEQAARAAAVDVVDMATAAPQLAWEIITTGRLVAERDEEAVESFVRRARHAADDDEQRLRMILLAQTGSVGGSPR